MNAISFGTLRFRGKPYIYREVKGRMVATEALQKEILLDYDAEAIITDEMFAGFVSEEDLYTSTDKHIIKVLDLEEEE